MAAGVLGGGADVEDDGVAGLEAAEEFVGVDGGGVVGAEVGAAGELRVRTVKLCDAAQGLPQPGDVVAGQGVEDAFAVASGLDQAGFAECFQVCGAGGDTHLCGVGEVLDAARTLAEQVQGSSRLGLPRTLPTAANSARGQQLHD